MSVPSSYLLKSVGFKKGMMIGFWTMSVGAFIFVPAAYTRTYEIFLLGLFTLGLLFAAVIFRATDGELFKQGPLVFFSMWAHRLLPLIRSLAMQDL